VKIWLDAQLSPSLCQWIATTFGVEAEPVLSVGMLEAEDPAIFEQAKRQDVDVVMTKDRDFVELVERLGPPPKVIWITVGNTSNRNLKRILSETLQNAFEILEAGEPLVEIGDAKPSKDDAS
jgi:predicted nuclease of predicted toxin-antitoxin system